MILDACGRAYADTHPTSVGDPSPGLEYTREHRLAMVESFHLRDVAARGRQRGPREALDLFSDDIASIDPVASPTCIPRLLILP